MSLNYEPSSEPLHISLSPAPPDIKRLHFATSSPYSNFMSKLVQKSALADTARGGVHSGTGPVFSMRATHNSVSLSLSLSLSLALSLSLSPTHTHTHVVHGVRPLL